MATVRSTTVVGATIGKHRIVRLIGGGEVSRVFACRDNDPLSDRMVAVKVLRSRASAVADRLLQEAAAVTKIASPHVVQLFDVSIHKNMPTIVMELVDGRSLAGLLEQGPLSAVDTLEVARSICLGLHAAWAMGVAHGDLRPSNVLLPEDDVRQAKVGDFLLAAPMADHAGVRGAASYLAPELLHGAAPDVQSDLYALGCLLFECAAGETPFTGNPEAVLKAHATKTAPSLGTRIQGPRGLVDLVDRLIDKDRGKRFKNHAEVLTSIARALRGTAAHASAQDRAQELDSDLVDEIEVETAPVSASAPKPAAAPPKAVTPPKAATPPKNQLPTSPGPPRRPPPPSLADLEIDPNAARDFAAVHDEGVEMTRVADASMLLRGAGAPVKAPTRPAPGIDELEIDPDAERAFDGVHDEGVEMTRVATMPTPLAAVPPRPKQPAALDMLTKMLDDGGVKSARPTSAPAAKRSAADIRGAPARAHERPPHAQPDEHDDKTQVAGAVAATPTSAEEADLIDEPLPPRAPRR
ncbi:MAG: protein kinase [Deltaproteobacteria bacterium]|nr:protein kinase [Deltaproteobacteria bacterium]